MRYWLFWFFFLLFAAALHWLMNSLRSFFSELWEKAKWKRFKTWNALWNWKTHRTEPRNHQMNCFRLAQLMKSEKQICIKLAARMKSNDCEIWAIKSSALNRSASAKCRVLYRAKWFMGFIYVVLWLNGGIVSLLWNSILNFTKLIPQKVRITSNKSNVLNRNAHVNDFVQISRSIINIKFVWFRC